MLRGVSLADIQNPLLEMADLSSGRQVDWTCKIYGVQEILGDLLHD